MQTSLSEHQQTRTGSGSRYVHETLTTTLTHLKTRDSPNTRLRPDGRLILLQWRDYRTAGYHGSRVRNTALDSEGLFLNL